MQTKLVDIKDLKPSNIRQEVLPNGFIERVRKYKEILKDVETSSLELTVSNFQRDLHPEKELIIWENIASIYQEILKETPKLTTRKKKGLFVEILKSTMFSVPDPKLGV